MISGIHRTPVLHSIFRIQCLLEVKQSNDFESFWTWPSTSVLFLLNLPSSDIFVSAHGGNRVYTADPVCYTCVMNSNQIQRIVSEQKTMKNQNLSPLTKSIIVTALVISFLISGLGGADVASASSASTPNRTDQLAAAANNTTINDVDKSWIYKGNWKVTKTKQTIGGQIHLSSEIGDHATITISGSAFVLIYSKHKNFGKLAVYIDDTLIKSIDQNNPRFKHQREWASPKLTPGMHTIKFVHASGDEVSVDALRVLGASVNSNPVITQTPTSEVSNPSQPPTPNELPTLAQDSSPTEIPTLIPSSTSTSPSTQAPTSTPVSTSSQAPSPTQTSAPTQAPTFTSQILTATSSSTQAPSPTFTSTPTQVPTSTSTAISASSGTLTSSTLQSMLDNMAAGSTLNVPAGNYSGNVNIKKSGTVNFVGVTVYGQVTNSASNVTINNLTVRDATLVGFLTTGSSVVVNNLSVYDTDQGNTSDADGVRVRGSATFNNVYINLDGGTKTTSHPDCVQFETWIGSANGVTFNGGTCINHRVTASGQVLETSGFMIEKESTSWTNVTIRNMLIVAFRGVNSSGGSNLTVENNTFVSTCLSCATPDTDRRSIGVYSGGNSGMLAFSRNIVLNFYAPVIVTGTKFTGSSSIVYCGTACRSDSGWSHTGQLWDVDPKLDANYIPLAGSPARLSNGYIGAFPPPTSPQVVPTSTAISAPTQPPTFTSPILTATSIATQAPSTFTSTPTQVPTSTFTATATQTQATIVTSTPSHAFPSSTLQSILDNMAAGSTLNVPAGNYSGSITIKKAGIINFTGVTILGRVTNAASNVTINNLTVRDSTLVGFQTSGSNVTVNNLAVYDTDQASTGDADGVRVRGDTVKFNNVYINLDGGTKTTSHPDCVQFETWVGSASNVTFDGLTCVNRWANSSGQTLETSGFMIEKESTGWSNVTIRNSLIITYVGINSSGGSGLTVENNTFISTCLSCVTPDTNRNSLGVYSGSNSGTLVFSRNILVNFNSPVIVTGTKLTGTQNIVYCGSPCRSDSGWSHTGQLWDVNPNLDANYVPMAGSPAYLSDGHIGAFTRP
jgi:hypothetical protein